MKEKVIVTGGSGFIGSNLVEKLIKENFEVYVLDKCPPKNKLANWINMDINQINPYMNIFNDVDYIYHLAATADVSVVKNDPHESIKTNFIGTSNLLEICKKNNIKRFIYASTVWVYSNTYSNNLYFSEDDIITPPENLYASLKYSSEIMIKSYCNEFKLPYTILRYGIPYGINMRENLVLPSMVKKALQDNKIDIHGTGEQIRSFIYIEDLVEAHLLALKSEGANQIFNIDGKQTITIKELAQFILEILDVHGSINYIPARTNDYKGKLITSSKANQILDWYPKKDLYEGLKETIMHYKDIYKKALPSHKY